MRSLDFVMSTVPRFGRTNGTQLDFLAIRTRALATARFAARYTRAAENAIAVTALLAIVLLPFIEIVARPVFGQGVPGSIDLVRHLTLWIGFLGAMIAAREGRHLRLGLAAFLSGKAARIGSTIAGFLGTAICVVLTLACLDMVQVDRESLHRIAGVLPQWVPEVIMPFGFAVIGARIAWSTAKTYRGRAIAVTAALLLSVALAVWPETNRSALFIPGVCTLLLAAIAGAPIFVVLGGIAALLFYVDIIPLASIAVEAYRIASNPILPTIPLFTLAGTILAGGQASSRLVRVFRHLFGWFPGGSAVAAIGVCAFFTTFTGGSGVAILALGGLMLPVLIREGYGEKFSVGALTASGSLGILLPPSLLIILYGVAAHTPINALFAAGILPGLLLVTMVSLYAIYRGRKTRQRASRFRPWVALAAIWQAKWEISLPIGVLVGIFSGIATLVEVASMAVIYTLIVEFIIHRELRIHRDLPKLLLDCAIMVGGITIILATAMGLTNYMIFADIPQLAAEWIQSATQNPLVFLLALNVFLLLAGCLLDIFSAIVVVVPLILPTAIAFGIEPVHLGIIFLANMELGYLTPPVGMNLYVASFRFGKPLGEVQQSTLPFFLIMLAGVLIITFVPALTTGVVEMLGF